jgi:transposase
MDVWKAFRNSAGRSARQAPIVFDKFHITGHLCDTRRRSEYRRLSGEDRAYLKGRRGE